MFDLYGEGMAENPLAVLRWYMEAGVDEAIGEDAVDRYVLSESQKAAAALREASRSGRDGPRDASRAAPGFQASGAFQASGVQASGMQAPAYQAASRPSPPSGGGFVSSLPDAGESSTRMATHLATQCRTLEELQQLVETFEGCPLKLTANRTVFADGNPSRPLMIVGEAPGRDEDREGKPFVGESGRLLSMMLASIGLKSRDDYYITNILPWRPPGNRTPTDAEVAVCLPLVRRHIELVQPKVLLLVGGLSAKSLLARTDGILRLRGLWQDYGSAGLSHPVPALATLHPAYLLRQPGQKRLAWRDLLNLQGRLREISAEAPLNP